MRNALFVLVTLLWCSGVAPARAADSVVVAVAPFTYSPHPIEVSEGQGLTFVNLDYFSGTGHTLAHDVPRGTELFQTPIVPVGTSAPVAGIADLPAGTYGFTCRVHITMSGKLIVREQGSAVPAGPGSTASYGRRS